MDTKYRSEKPDTKLKMDVGWGSLPLLPLGCVLDHLSMEDALAASSTCRHWRNAILVFARQRDLLKLEVKNLEKSLFLTRLFKKNTRRLHIYIDTTGQELDTFMKCILPLFFETMSLNELAFIGPSYASRYYTPTAELKRIIVESLIFKHRHSLQRLILLGCEMATPKNDNDRFVHKHLEQYSRPPLSFSTVPSLDDTILTRRNVELMMFSTLQNIVIDYEYLSPGTIDTLTQLPHLSLLTLNIGHKQEIPRLEWPPQSLKVAINIISVPAHRFYEIMKQVLVEDLQLVSLKVMFCKTFHIPLLSYISRLYKRTLQELVWVDAPADTNAPSHRIVEPKSEDMCVNHILLLCWQCVHLRRLVIHGYWLWQYDVAGMLRLRRSLEHFDVSAVYGRQDQYGFCGSNVMRVLASDNLAVLDNEYVRKINKDIEFKWVPSAYAELPRALKRGASPKDRADYIAYEMTKSPLLQSV
ncbi:unnamed protein product [Leptosia nina]|uniref:F-box domain-containing protein n=1 Tax=Leptosia nina TaxID=320188 RepID=A0AAV1JEJ4_9NEOP